MGPDFSIPACQEVARCCRQEFEVLRGLSHPNIITAVDFLELQNEAALVFEYCCDMTLQSLVKRSFPGTAHGSRTCWLVKVG